MLLALLGQQRFDPNLGSVAAALGVTGKVALVTAGWQEREREDEELTAHLGERTVNLELHRRADDVFARDTEFRDAYRARQLVFRQIQDTYRIRLASLIETAKVIASRAADDVFLEEERKTSITAIRVLDRYHLQRCEQIRADFMDRCDPSTRDVVNRHREEVRSVLQECEAVAIAGGHVASLVNRLHLFDLAGAVGERPVLAWSAGAMAITDKVVIFHDQPPHGVAAPQILDAGLGLAPAVVALPNPSARLALDDAERMRMYARRFAPARCVALPRRAYLTMEGGEITLADGALELREDGAVEPLAPTAEGGAS